MPETINLAKGIEEELMDAVRSELDEDERQSLDPFTPLQAHLLQRSSNIGTLPHDARYLWLAYKRKESDLVVRPGLVLSQSHSAFVREDAVLQAVSRLSAEARNLILESARTDFRNDIPEQTQLCEPDIMHLNELRERRFLTFVDGFLRRDLELSDEELRVQMLRSPLYVSDLEDQQCVEALEGSLGHEPREEGDEWLPLSDISSPEFLREDLRLRMQVLLAMHGEEDSSSPEHSFFQEMHDRILRALISAWKDIAVTEAERNHFAETNVQPSVSTGFFTRPRLFLPGIDVGVHAQSILQERKSSDHVFSYSTKTLHTTHTRAGSAIAEKFLSRLGPKYISPVIAGVILAMTVDIERLSRTLPERIPFVNSSDKIQAITGNIISRILKLYFTPKMNRVIERIKKEFLSHTSSETEI